MGLVIQIAVALELKAICDQEGGGMDEVRKSARFFGALFYWVLLVALTVSAIGFFVSGSTNLRWSDAIPLVIFFVFLGFVHVYTFKPKLKDNESLTFGKVGWEGDGGMWSVSEKTRTFIGVTDQSLKISNLTLPFLVPTDSYNWDELEKAVREDKRHVRIYKIATDADKKTNFRLQLSVTQAAKLLAALAEQGVGVSDRNAGPPAYVVRGTLAPPEEIATSGEIEKLHALFTKGALTQEEFDLAKKKILGL